MKFIILFLISFSAVAGFPPTTLKGQSQSTATTTFNFQVPNNQATKTATGTLVETGSQNLLSNPGFEHSTVGTDWNVTNGTLTASGSAPFGSFSGTFSGSVANGNIQSLTGSGTAQAGLNCLVSAFVKTASSNVQLCAIHNGTLNTNLCVNVNSNNTWAQYQIPTVCDAVSTVARIRITTSVSTTFDADNVFVGVNPNFGSVAQAQLAGESYFAGTASCSWSRGSTTIGAFGATAACPGPTIVKQNIGSWATTDSDLPRQTITNLPPGDYKVTFIAAQAMGAIAASALTITDGITTCQPIKSNESNAAYWNQTVSCLFSYSQTQSSVSFELQAASASSTVFIQNTMASAPAASGLRLQVEYYPPASSIVTTNNQDYDWTAYTPTSPNGSFGTLTNVVAYHKRQGSDLLIRARFTTGTLAASEARISLPTGLTSSSTIGTLETCGSVNHNYGFGTVPSVLIEPSVSYVTFGGIASGGGANTQLTKQNANFLTNSGNIYSFEARIPIQGWNNNNVIVGTFANIPSISNIATPKLFSYKVTTTSGVVANSMGGVVSTCTAANPTVCTFSGLTATPNCTSTINQSSAAIAVTSSVSSTSLTVGSYLTTAGTPLASQDVIINCMGY